MIQTPPFDDIHSMVHPGRWLIALALLLAVRAGWASFTLEEFEQWSTHDGQRIRVMSFPGIKTFSRSDLLMIMATDKPTWIRRYLPIGHRVVFYADDFAADLLRIERFYAREGFPDANVKGIVKPRGKDLEVKFEIEEGPPIILSSWRFVWLSDSGAGLDSVRWSKKLLIKNGKRLALSDVQSSADTLRYLLQTIGHARANVSFDVKRDAVNYTAQLDFLLQPGHYNYFGTTRFTGLRQFTEQTVRRELTYHEQDHYDIRELEKTRIRIVRLEAFNFVSARADTSVPGDVLPVSISTEEGNRYRLRMSGGYHTLERARAEAEFTDLNFFGRGRRWTLHGTRSEFRREVDFRLFWPHTPWNFTDITEQPKWELLFEPGLHLETRSVTTTLSASPSLNVTTALSNEAGIVIRRWLSVSNEDSLITRYVRSVERFTAGWDVRDNPLVTRKGHFLGGTIAESGAFYGATFRWWKTMLNARAWVPQGRFWTLAGRADAGVMGPLFQSPRTPIDDRFKLGGPGTVRGWARETLSPRAEDGTTPIGGDFTLSATTEVRRNIWGPVVVAVFLDVGNVWKNYWTAKLTDMYPSAGAGLMVISPVGPVRVDYAKQLRPNPYGDEKTWAIHISLGSGF